ncbi:cellulose synthase-like protein B4 [Abrus precatorius]|uniref:Cellulose synthase-like protein B4 n=1 Tax=Abrus precatorius TaxID=3816 RepID=A0A8B8K828_ABRPR|nr:cellulose synthase-like protein B4 [Abrus precatorius]
MDILVLLLLLMLLSVRFFSINTFTLPWFLAFLCESWFTFTWIVILNAKWSPAITITHIDRLMQRLVEVPRVDLFVTTADPILEPPIVTVNTVLSLMALDYPTNKLACYVSDDGCSPLTYYALVEASKFAKHWVPFCKNYNIQVRAPFRCFSDVPITKSDESMEFMLEWSRMKDMYGRLSQNIKDVSQKPTPFPLDGEFADFSNAERRNHASIIKIILENKEGLSDELPHLVYISREKRPQYPHNNKAGAMNVLTRVSGLMTDAPFMLNVDCDMFVNNPKIVYHAMCILMDSEIGKEVAFVQYFQQFYDGLKNDPFGNQLVAAFEYIIRGIAGLQGPYYVGTNTFHRRKAIYGLYPNEIESSKKGLALTQLHLLMFLGYFKISNETQNKIPYGSSTGKLPEKILMQQFGCSKEFIKSATHAVQGSAYYANDISPSKFIEAAIQVANCGYEYGTSWGNKIGWLYGSVSEDIPTGFNIHRKGWRSECCTPDPIAFTGCAPRGLVSTMIQQKRWASGVTVSFFGKHSPLLGFLFGKIQFRTCLSYFWIANWGIRSVFEVCYAALPAYCIITNTNIFPKGLGLWAPIALFVVYMVHTLLEYRSIGLPIRHWWNNQRMSIIRTTTAWFIGNLDGMLKVFGVSDAVFQVTQKESSDADGGDADDGRFTFDESLVFVAGTTILLVQLTTLIIWIFGLQMQATKSGNGSGPGELICVMYLLACYWQYLKGLFGKGKYGVPSSTICKSAVLALVFVHLCRSTAIG